MKKSGNIFVLSLLIISLFSIKIAAQQTDENTLIINRYFHNISAEQAQLNNGNLTEQELRNLNAVNNAELNILQSGNYNLINVKTNSNNQNVGQVGDYNSYEFISYYGRDDLNFEVQQIGSDNFIQVLGENSLINNMKIIQKSNSKTITITNY